ncbi:Liprin-beta-1 [Fragariocoptes setiger]|uniref:Liprin-beta-1 n=1 Tax=Fragariocoptes setiger TaxID=1670756 RepID=A0ABQ7S6E1_9ACAR|nr:Liprin-beta-1 [Fragariocoptes setiger]
MTEFSHTDTNCLVKLAAQHNCRNVDNQIIAKSDNVSNGNSEDDLNNNEGANANKKQLDECSSFPATSSTDVIIKQQEDMARLRDKPHKESPRSRPGGPIVDDSTDCSEQQLTLCYSHNDTNVNGIDVDDIQGPQDIEKSSVTPALVDRPQIRDRDRAKKQYLIEQRKLRSHSSYHPGDYKDLLLSKDNSTCEAGDVVTDQYGYISSSKCEASLDSSFSSSNLTSSRPQKRRRSCSLIVVGNNITQTTAVAGCSTTTRTTTNIKKTNACDRNIHCELLDDNNTFGHTQWSHSNSGSLQHVACSSHIPYNEAVNSLSPSLIRTHKSCTDIVHRKDCVRDIIGESPPKASHSVAISDCFVPRTTLNSNSNWECYQRRLSMPCTTSYAEFAPYHHHHHHPDRCLSCQALSFVKSSSSSPSHHCDCCHNHNDALASRILTQSVQCHDLQGHCETTRCTPHLVQDRHPPIISQPCTMRCDEPALWTTEQQQGSTLHEQLPSTSGHQIDVATDKTVYEQQKQYDEIRKKLELKIQAQNEQIQMLVDQAQQQADKMSGLEAALISTNRTCHQLEAMLKQELSKRSSLESDSRNLMNEINKLRAQIAASEQIKMRDDEKISLLNATLMERETEVSILKLKLTRATTSASAATLGGGPQATRPTSQAMTIGSTGKATTNNTIFTESDLYGSIRRPTATHRTSNPSDGYAMTSYSQHSTPQKRVPARRFDAFDTALIPGEGPPPPPSSSSSPGAAAATVREDIPLPVLQARPTPATPTKQASGLRRIFSKLRRTGSSARNVVDSDDESTPEMYFKRGGVARNTTHVGVGSSSSGVSGPMSLHHQGGQLPNCSSKPFAEWDTNLIADWLTMIGLSMYSNQCKRWVKSGAHLMNATSAEVERGLGISNSLHRKKLRLAISELNDDCDKITKAAANLDYLWVARWLDDIGLSQYKEAFINARIDGRVLNYLTVDDLANMQITSVLHHASIRCGIRVLRSINFDLQALRRRATAAEIDSMQRSGRTVLASGGIGGSLTRQGTSGSITNGNEQSSTDNQRAPAQADVALWTCHRVMEWLRTIDLSEFAPNLRGSGVHGGLIVYEDGFNADLLSTLLSVPDDKTLLRRHIYTLFKELIGTELAQQKRQYESMPNYTPLSPTAEIKVPRKSQFSSLLRRKSSKVGQNNLEVQYLCPMFPMDRKVLQEFKAKAAEQTNKLYQQQQEDMAQQQQQRQQREVTAANV